jgi:hypothetical protein
MAINNIPAPVQPLSASTYSDGGPVVDTGTGTGQAYHVRNDTGETQYFTFSAGSDQYSGYSGDVKAVMKLEPGQTGTFVGGSDVPGIRINTSDANGNSHMNQSLFEDTAETHNSMSPGTQFHNPDISDVAGNVGFNGQREYITVNDGSRTIGDGQATGAYMYDIQDRDPNRATNPMNMALDKSNEYYIDFSNTQFAQDPNHI